MLSFVAEILAMNYSEWAPNSHFTTSYKYLKNLGAILSGSLERSL